MANEKKKTAAQLTKELDNTFSKHKADIADAIDQLQEDEKTATNEAKTAKAKIDSDLATSLKAIGENIDTLNELHHRATGDYYLNRRKATTKPGKAKTEAGSKAAGDKAVAYLKSKKGEAVTSKELAAHIGTSAVTPSIALADDANSVISDGPGRAKVYRYKEAK